MVAVEEFIKKINDIFEIVKKLAKEKGLQCEISLTKLSKYYYIHTIYFIYKEWECKTQISYHLDLDKDLIKVAIKTNKTNTESKVKLEELETWVKDELNTYLSKLVKEWKELEKIYETANEIAKVFETYLGIKPEVKYFPNYLYSAKFVIKKDITIRVIGKLHNNIITIEEIEINGNITDKHVEQIVEIFKAMTAFL